MTKQQRLWQKRRKNKATRKRVLLVRIHLSPRKWWRALPRIPGASIPISCQKGSLAIFPQPACWCSQTRSSLCLNWRRRKSAKDGNSHTLKQQFFSLKSALEKNPPLYRTKQRSPCHSFPVISAWKNYCEQRVGHEYSTSITAANFINYLLKGHRGKIVKGVIYQINIF